MTQALRERNVKFFDHLVNVGVIDEDQYDFIQSKCEGCEEKQILFEISNFFANFTASDWFDLSCRIYRNWQNVPEQSQSKQHQPVEQPKKSSQTTHSVTNNNREQQEPIRAKDQSNGSTAPSSKENRKVLESNPVSNKAREAPSRNQVQEDPQYITPHKNLSSTAVREQLSKLAIIMEANALYTGFSELKDFDYHYKMFLQEQLLHRSQKEPKSYHRNELSPRQNERSSSNYKPLSSDRDHHNKLYEDYFQKKANMELKREVKKASELDDCTFVPQINRVDNTNPNLANTLRVPVYDRLLQSKKIPTNVVLEKHEYRELKGATFQPDISKSQKSKVRQEEMTSPEDRKKLAVDRLYGDALIKEKILFLKQMNRKEQEVEGCTFSPKVKSPQRDRDFSRGQLTKSVDRLYDDNMKRHRKLLKKEVESREKEMEDCTFHPERMAKNYKSKNPSELEDLEVHDRLYERFKKKQYDSVTNQSLSQDHFYSSSKHNRSLNPNRSFQDKTSPREAGEEGDVNTPAFDRLYRDMLRRKVKKEQLKEKINKEEGVTFKPKTNSAKKNIRSNSGTNRSYQDIKNSSRYESKQNTEGDHDDQYYAKKEPAKNKLYGRK